DVIVGGQTCWTSIVKEARSLKDTGINVVDLIRLKLRNEDSSLFWDDKWNFWSLESEGDYSVASIRKLIDEKTFPEGRMDIDILMCPVCKGGVETTSHLFFQCVLSKQIMRKVSSWWNVNYTDVSSYEEWRVWLVSQQAFINKLLFDNKTPKKALIFDNLVSLSFNWCKYKCKASFKWND
nr:RNA-directed DNA polymerase, eukaryota [Tanacetum cinerariifolium]